MQAMDEIISATDAARHFSDVLNRVAFQQQSLEIHRGGKPVARLVPIRSPGRISAAVLGDFLASLPDLGEDAEDFAKDVRMAGSEAMPDDPWAS